MKHRLTFINPTTHRGANTTIRRGVDWFDRAFVGDEVEIYLAGSDEPIEIGIITEMKSMSFRQVTLQDLFDEHDLECHTPHGLVYAMLRAYPDFTLDDIVTIIRFEIRHLV